MKIGKLTSIGLFMILCFFSSCSKEESKTIEDGNVEFDSHELTQQILGSLNSLEKAQFSPVELSELEGLLRSTSQDIDNRSGAVIEIPADSQDALAGAIAEAESGQTILLKAGIHVENSTVNLNKKVNIIGEEGAIWQTHTQAALDIGVVEPALHIDGVSGVKIRGINFESQNPLGGTAILVENAPKTQVLKNDFKEHEIGVLIHNSDRVIVSNNTFITSLGWTLDPAAPGFGIAVVNGKNARILGNDITASVFGVWACDTGGWYMGNTTHGNFIGMILCKVPANSFPLPSGEIIGSDRPANNWLTLYNSSFENLNVGYLVVDGANKNFLSSNWAKDNGSYDIELAGATERFGFLAPTSANNRVFSRRDIKIKDCGESNWVRGGEAIDTGEDPCY